MSRRGDKQKYWSGEQKDKNEMTRKGGKSGQSNYMTTVGTGTMFNRSMCLCGAGGIKPLYTYFLFIIFKKIFIINIATKWINNIYSC